MDIRSRFVQSIGSLLALSFSQTLPEGGVSVSSLVMATSPVVVCLSRICICGKQYPGWKTVRQSAAMRHILRLNVSHHFLFFIFY